MSQYLSQRPAAREAGPELLVLQRWEEFCAWLIPHTGRWPKSSRFTFGQRVQNRARPSDRREARTPTGKNPGYDGG